MIVIIDNVRSMHNVGSILRTADGAGVEKVYMSGVTPIPVDRLNRKRLPMTKISLGAEDSVAWEHVASTSRLITRLRREKYIIVALEQSKQSVDYRSLRFGKRARIALIVGNEVIGISSNVLKRCDYIVDIPMLGTKESLNVSVAFGIFAYHFLR